MDSQGRRSGKVLDYKMSETRVLEVLEGGRTPDPPTTLDPATWRRTVVSDSVIFDTAQSRVL